MSSGNMSTAESVCETAGTAAVNRVAMRVPPFWPFDPEIWFWQVEMQFAVNKVTQDDTKFQIVVVNLDASYISEVRDIIAQPSEKRKYDELRAELIRRLSSTQEQKTKRLLENEEMGDRKPSQFLRCLQNLAGNAVPTNLVRSLWLGRLPSSLQAILATQANADLEIVAELADAVFEALPRHQIAAIAKQKLGIEEAVEKLVSGLATLSATVVQMRTEIAEIRGSDNNHRRSTSRNEPRSRSGSRTSGLCWYHFRFGADSKKCRAPCSFQQENSNSSR